MAPTISYYETLTQMTCGNCGVAFAIPETMRAEKERDGGSWYCPNGHSRVYTESVAEKLAKAEERLRVSRQREQATRDLLAAEERSHRATRGVVTRQKKKLVRVANGVCPCCNRTFQNLLRHMDTKHPDYTPKIEAGEEIAAS